MRAHATQIWNAPDNSADVYSAQSLAAGLGTSSPLPYITQIGNHLWTLSVQQFDLGPGDNANREVNKTSINPAPLEDAENESAPAPADGDVLGGVAAQWVASVAKATVSLCTVLF